MRRHPFKRIITAKRYTIHTSRSGSTICNKVKARDEARARLGMINNSSSQHSPQQFTTRANEESSQLSHQRLTSYIGAPQQTASICHIIISLLPINSPAHIYHLSKGINSAAALPLLYSSARIVRRREKKKRKVGPRAATRIPATREDGGEKSRAADWPEARHGGPAYISGVSTTRAHYNHHDDWFLDSHAPERV